MPVHNLLTPALIPNVQRDGLIHLEADNRSGHLPVIGNGLHKVMRRDFKRIRCDVNGVITGLIDRRVCRSHVSYCADCRLEEASSSQQNMVSLRVRYPAMKGGVANRSLLR